MPNFRSDNLLNIALTDLSTLDNPTPPEQIQLKKDYRRLAHLGDYLIDAVLTDYLFHTYPTLTKEDMDNWRQDIASRESLTDFAIEMGLPDVCSSWNKIGREPPETEPGVYGEMFEALVAVIYIDQGRDLTKLSAWLCDRFICDAIQSYEEDYDETLVTTADYLDIVGLEGSLGSVWAPGDDDD
ncbi:ribonuclease III domain-containing protein [Pseudanabaena sp. FACHB-2040]|uniref:ribonuclease III domain-containing protein n=1 Tax=Pseudanabaena sp. FACHB-2040 TaxID=2692859 RepID=UPI0016856911|nr:ribonuclease III domain-containing protein [Pseudanabaena sp. FACHB-2040]MBD2261233.1 hypothetical protein [Pseudanabaena sp. FACHB-2040]